MILVRIGSVRVLRVAVIIFAVAVFAFRMVIAARRVIIVVRQLVGAVTFAGAEECQADRGR